MFKKKKIKILAMLCVVENNEYRKKIQVIIGNVLRKRLLIHCAYHGRRVTGRSINHKNKVELRVLPW